jgi:hypothetical protein
LKVSPPLVIELPRSTKLWLTSKSTSAVVVPSAAMVMGLSMFTLIPLRDALGKVTFGVEVDVSTVPSFSVTLDFDGSMTRRAA